MYAPKKMYMMLKVTMNELLGIFGILSSKNFPTRFPKKTPITTRAKSCIWSIRK